MPAPYRWWFTTLSGMCVWLALASPSGGQIVHTSFETPPVGTAWQVFSQGSLLEGWVVESGTVEIVGTYWQAAEGRQSLDLNGVWEQTGTIYQDVPVEPGGTYRLRFAMAGNPDGGPAVKSLRVQWQGALLADLEFDSTGKTRAAMDWQYHEFTLTATGTVARLRFQSTSATFCGPTLDDISLTALAVTNPPPIPHQPSLDNWDFEQPPGICTYTVFDGSRPPPGWNVASGTVEIVGPYWQAAQGRQSLDLNGIYEQIGTIYKDLPTLPGTPYRVRFAMAGNPEGGPVVKTMRVSWQGEPVQELAFDTTGRSATNMGWRYHEYTLLATGTVTRLQFQSTCPSFCGPVLDDISVRPVRGPALTNAGPAATNLVYPPLPPLVTFHASRLTAPAAPQLVIHGRTGETYRIEAAEDPVKGPWEAVGTVTLTGSPVGWQDPAGITARQRFYRAVLVK